VESKGVKSNYFGDLDRIQIHIQSVLFIGLYKPCKILLTDLLKYRLILIGLLCLSISI
jgi:hypothetical protein